MKYLLTISLGPVQEFIAAARRTADLRAGSQLLQGLAMHVASELAGRNGSLIFPADARTPGPNKVVAEIDTDAPAQLAKELRQSAVAWLKQRWNEARQKLGGVPIDDDLANHQVKHFLEFYAAWVPLNGQYAEARRQAELLLAGRKALRDFAPTLVRPGRPKSPLDPSRDSVLKVNALHRVPDSALEAPLMLKPREYLDAISILKRVMGSTEKGVPSTSLMAARAVVMVAEKRNPEAVEKLQCIADGTPGRADIGDLMFPTRVQDEIETGEPHVRNYLKEHLSEINSLRKEILETVRASECPPYYALLVADGDRMGKLIRGLDTPDKHRELSQRLAQFAKQVDSILQVHKGYCVYSGGDDVLALLPVTTIIPAAVELRGAFHSHLQDIATADAGTLSVGIAIVHCLENLWRALEWARETEGKAKEQRNALAIALHPRGGAPLSAVTSFADDPMLDSWTRWINAFRAGLTHGFPYELAYLARETQEVHIDPTSLKAEVLRIFDRKQGREAAGQAKQFRPLVEQEMENIRNAAALNRFAERLMIARFLSGYPEVSS